MDFDISHLSPKARMRLGRCFHKMHLPKVFWVIPVAAIAIGIGLAFYIDQVTNHNNALLIALGAVVFVFFCAYFAWTLKKEPEAYKKFKDKFLSNGVFPKCFECNKDNPDKLEKCAFCGADLKIRLLGEANPNGILSFNNLLKEKPVQHSAILIFCTSIALTMLYFSLFINSQLLLFNWSTTNDSESYDKQRVTWLEAGSDIENGIIRYLIPRPGGYSTDDSGRRLNGVPVYYNHYSRNSTAIAVLGKTMIESEKTLAINRAVTYNSYMTRVIHNKDFLKQNKDSMVMLSGQCACGQHIPKVRIFPKCYFDQKVRVNLPGGSDFQGTVCGIETDKAGKVTYAVRIDRKTVRREIPEDNIALIPEDKAQKNATQ